MEAESEARTAKRRTRGGPRAGGREIACPKRGDPSDSVSVSDSGSVSVPSSTHDRARRRDASTSTSRATT